MPTLQDALGGKLQDHFRVLEGVLESIIPAVDLGAEFIGSDVFEI
jgi:hypothetical protein